MRLTSTGVLVLSVLVFAVPANAGNGNGNGNGSAGANESAPGNSANAPGQLKKDAETAAAPTIAAEPSAPVATVGVKPSSDTAHDTHAEAQSNETKQYGNGATAGQIAVKNGAAPTTKLHGPGNSQPHKAAACAGGHEVDVHALKGRRAGACGGGTPEPRPTPDPPGVTLHDVMPPVVSTTSAQPKSDPARTPAAVDPAPQPGTAGDAPSALASRSGNEVQEGVLGAAGRVGRAASLPFTGQRLWLAVLVGVLLIATGLALREIRISEAAVESGHDHSDRPHQPARSSRPPLGGRASR